MIQGLREKLTGIIAIAIIILLAIPLAFVGVDSLFLNSNRVTNVGSVNGHDITEIDFLRAVAARENQISQLLGENYTPGLIDEAQIESAALRGLVDLFLYVTHANEYNLDVSEAYVARQIQLMPQFQVNGQFSEILFSNYLAQSGYTSATFIEALSDELVSNLWATGLQTSTLATQPMLEKNIAVSQEKRSYQTLVLDVQAVLGEVEVSEEEVAEYYAQNQDSFQRPERISVDYVELSAANFIDDVEVTEAEIQQRFALVQASMPARRQAAHILVEAEEGDAHFSVLDEIQLKLEEGADFADLAAEYSDDIGSSGSGGVLGYSDGSSFPAEFEAALAQLQVDEVSGPVLTDAGVHIIKLMDIDQAQLLLADEAPALEAELKLEKAGDIYRQNLDLFRDAAFSTDNLDQLVSEFSSVTTLQPSSTTLFDRQTGAGIAADPTVRTVAFSEFVLDQNLNSEAIEINDNTASVVVHLRERVPEGVAPLVEVRDQIIGAVTINKGSALLEDRAQAILSRLEAGEEVEDVARDEDIEWEVQLDAVRGTGGLAGQAIFSAPITGSLPVIGSEIQPNGDYLIYSIDEVTAGSLDDFNETQVSQLAFQLSQLVASGEGRAYLSTLRSNADIDLKVDIEVE